VPQRISDISISRQRLCRRYWVLTNHTVLVCGALDSLTDCEDASTLGVFDGHAPSAETFDTLQNSVHQVASGPREHGPGGERNGVGGCIVDHRPK
jgi:hypothetical protein